MSTGIWGYCDLDHPAHEGFHDFIPDAIDGISVAGGCIGWRKAEGVVAIRLAVIIDAADRDARLEQIKQFGAEVLYPNKTIGYVLIEETTLANE